MENMTNGDENEEVKKQETMCIGTCFDCRQVTLNTVNIGFRNQPPSEGSRLLNPVEVTKVSGFLLPTATSWSLKAKFP